MEKNQLDKRKLADIRRELKSRAAAYVPQWHYITEDPDCGSVIAEIYAEQTVGNIREYNKLFTRYEEELAGLVSLRLKGAAPAEGVVVLQAAADGIRELDLAKDTRFYAVSEEKDAPIVFSSTHDVHATNARITEILGISESSGQVRAYGGLEGLCCPLHMFDAGGGEPYKNELVIFHPWLFAGEGREIDLDVGDAGLMHKLCDSMHYEMAYLTEDGERKICPRKQLGKIRVTGADGACALVIRRKKPVRRGINFPRLEFHTGRYKEAPEFLTDGSRELAGDKIAVCGEEITLYAQCYIGLKKELVHAGVTVRIEADLEYGHKNHYVSLPKEAELKLIKRAPRPGTEVRTAEVYITETGFCYYNGSGFRSISCNAGGGIFAGEHTEGHMALVFTCPADMEPISLAGWEGYVLCLQVVKAENCYLRPAVHHYPILSNIEVIYDLGSEAVVPGAVIRKQGNREVDLTDDVKGKRPIPAFAAFEHHGEAMLFGFGRKPGRGMASLYLTLQGFVDYKKMELQFSYSSGEGFRPLRVIDSTKGLTVSGLWRFFVPEDMQKQEIEGKKACWIRVEAVGKEEPDTPAISGIYMNGVQVRNVERSPQKDYFLEKSEACMTFPVYGGQVLSTRVWVNEVNRLTAYQMRRMLKSHKDRVYAECNSQGIAAAFYVLWEEVPDFLNSAVEDRHYVLDRRKKQIRFGDGAFVRIPHHLGDAAFRVEVESCDGSMGNVDAMAVNRLVSPLLDIETVYNPLEMSGGSDMEGAECIRQKSSVFLGTSGRLVTQQDYLREAVRFSEGISQVRCQVQGSCITVCVLMKDYEAGTASFRRIQEPLRQYFIRRGTGFLDIRVCEPVFVKVRIRLWVEAEDLDRALEEKEELLSYMKGLFQRPVIGRIPEEEKLLVMIRARMRSLRLVCHYIEASYVRGGREYARELKDLKGEPFILCAGGSHEITVL